MISKGASIRTGHVVARLDEISEGQRKIGEIEGRSIGVFNVHGTFYALRNRCPHQGAPLCQGSVKGTALPTRPGEYEWVRDGEILRCPWHGWEFDITTGRNMAEPERWHVRQYEVTLEEAGSCELSTLDAETFPVTTEGNLVVVHV
jgi:nitrite reductase/ring-hydroxylating ferredoxin subunit